MANLVSIIQIVHLVTVTEMYALIIHVLPILSALLDSHVQTINVLVNSNEIIMINTNIYLSII